MAELPIKPWKGHSRLRVGTVLGTMARRRVLINSGLQFREPIFATVRELVMSYFEHYYNPAGEKSLRAFSRPVSLARFDRSLSWMSTLSEVWEIPEYLCE